MFAWVPCARLPLGEAELPRELGSNGHWLTAITMIIDCTIPPIIVFHGEHACYRRGEGGLTQALV